MLIKKFAKRLLPHLPRWAQQVIRKRAERERLRQHAARKERSRVPLDSVIAQLQGMGLRADVMVHGSISNIGKLDKPVPDLVKELVRIVDVTQHTLLVPALPYNTTMVEYLEGAPSFDVRTAKNAMGAIPNLVMGMPGALRSVHPSHSVVAVGPRAEHYVAEHQLDSTPFASRSPFLKLTVQRGQILLIGVGLNSVTCFHVYEDLLGANCPVQVYGSKDYAVPCLDQDGSELTVITRAHNPQVSAQRECERARKWLQQAGAIKTVQLGESELSLIDAWLFTRTLLEHLRRGESIYGKVKLKPEHLHAIDQALANLQSAA
jgi:aminoglycoside 3-N-acetyltransferase